MEHEFFRCTNPDCSGCFGCENVLQVCMICLASEGELLTYCPGFELSPDALEACYEGSVIDLERYRNAISL